MTVRELLIELAGMDPDAEVLVDTYEEIETPDGPDVTGEYVSIAGVEASDPPGMVMINVTP